MEPVYNVENYEFPTVAQENLSSVQIEKIIANTLVEKGWVILNTTPGKLHCKITWRSHSAEVDVTYSQKSYSITLAKSENLKETADMIHRNYNHRVQQLQSEIDKRLYLAGNK